jgi:hypothetical protein
LERLRFSLIWRSLQYRPSSMCPLLLAWIRGTKFILKTNKCNFIANWPPTRFGHSYGHLQGGKNKNTNNILYFPYICLKGLLKFTEIRPSG